MVTKEEIFEATDGGLDIILAIYPQAADSVHNKKRKFKVRDAERTPSSNLYKDSKGVWKVVDFGEDGKARHAIDILAKEQFGGNFGAAMKEAAARWGVGSSSQKKPDPKAELIVKKAKPEEKTGDFSIKVTDFTEAHIKAIFSKHVIAYHDRIADSLNNDKLEAKVRFKRLIEICGNYHFHALESFTTINDERKAVTVKSTEEFPIFCIDQGEWVKIIQPKSKDKAFRFRYLGKKPSQFLHGKNLCEKLYQQIVNRLGDDPTNQDPELPERLDKIILMSGDRDALNVAALGYNVIWGNSETEGLDGKTYGDIARMCDKLYNLGDIDETGLAQMHKKAMIYLDMHTIMLPQELLLKRDFRGNSCKDVRDYLEHWSKKDFDNLVDCALPYRFWDEFKEPDGKGNFKATKYFFNYIQAFNFLERNGFYRYPRESEKDGYVYIQITNNVVKEILPTKIRSFIRDFLAERKQSDQKLRNTMIKSNPLSDQLLANLAEVVPDFTDFYKCSQYIFFQNKTWQITANEITEFQPSEAGNYVWENEVIRHNITKQGSPFQIKFDGDTGTWSIDILNKDCMFLKFITNTARMHWRKELEDRATGNEEEDAAYYAANQFNISGPRLTQQEIDEQNHHLVNRIFCLGYLLHRYKFDSRAWFVWAMENTVAEEGDSHGGSGKSITMKALEFLMKSVRLDGRNPDLTGDKFIFEMVNEHTDYILIDDCHAYVNLGFFFASVTGTMKVNPKNNAQFNIPYELSPKLAFSSNYPPRNVDLSTDRRMIYTVFSDYYHTNGLGHYREERTPETEFGCMLYKDFDQVQWNHFYNTMAYCLQFYLHYGKKLNPPMDNVNQRNMLAEMGEAFNAWADVMFSPDGKYINVMVPKTQLFEDFMTKNKTKWATQKFTKSMQLWCKYRGYELNPNDLKNSQKRIVRPLNGMSTEMIYVRTPGAPITDHVQALPKRDAYRRDDRSPQEPTPEGFPSNNEMPWPTN